MTSWTFEGVNPTIFNFSADLLSVAFQTIFALGASHAFVYLMSRHLQQGHSIPTKALGKVPSSFAGSCYFAYLLKLSGPALALSLLLAVGEFSHSVSDLGLSFVTVQTEGPLETVLALDRRNPGRLFQLSGDPAILRTNALSTSLVTAAQMDYVEPYLSQSRREQRMIESFLNAADDIAAGGSPFANYAATERIDLDYGGVSSSAFYGEKILSKIDMELPLDCSTSSMVNVPQTIRGLQSNPLFELVPLQNLDATVPNCAFNAPRSTGIFDKSNSSAEILEYMFSYTSVLLEKAGTLSPAVTFTFSDRALALDRDDWKLGRVVHDISGMRYGNVTIQLNATVLATADFGPADRLEDIANGSEHRFIQSRNYYIVSNVIGACPPLPSGRTKEKNLECLVISQLFCSELFGEDIWPYIPSDFAGPVAEFSGSPPSEDTTCGVQNAHIVWGRNFVAGAELVAVVSAILTRAQVNPTFQVFQQRVVVRNSILAALFALSTTAEKPSIQPKVSPRINLVFIFFIILPVLATVVIMLVTFKREKLPVPIDGWQLIVLGREEEEIPTREEDESEFPEAAAKNYEFAIREDTSNRKTITSEKRLGIYQTRSMDAVEGEPTTSPTSIHCEESSVDNQSPLPGDPEIQNSLGVALTTPDDPPGKIVEHGVSIVTCSRPA